ncbi:hypothetical protein RBXJA2T_05663 [Rubrivivax benzoatilyticus JA2 = ATCC BAA-35]|nr:hypothetical protein RBXJA2T_05663 [Rubrivivax benzoatilyticus JA2 = ATCC BAA-35]
MAGTRTLAGLVIAAACTGAWAQVDAGWECGNPFKNHFGPFDYRKADAGTKQLVEGAHFTPGVESLTKPKTTTYATMAGDVGYTLHVFPNHHRALMTMTRLGERHNSPQPPAAKFTIDCYYKRAVVYAPDDTVVRALYARYLFKQERRDEALQQLAAGAQQAGDNPLSHFNLGLVYFDIGDYDRAAEQALKARELGMPRTELIDRLKGVNKWVEPGG